MGIIQNHIDKQIFLMKKLKSRFYRSLNISEIKYENDNVESLKIGPFIHGPFLILTFGLFSIVIFLFEYFGTICLEYILEKIIKRIYYFTKFNLIYYYFYFRRSIINIMFRVNLLT